MSTPAKGPRARARQHDWIDERKRAMHVRVAEKLRADPGLIRTAWENLERWEGLRGPEPVYDEWREILSWPLEALLEVLVEESEPADRLRQSSPFAGVLTPAEGMAIIEYYETL
jgi:hypothetical protein